MGNLAYFHKVPLGKNRVSMTLVRRHGGNAVKEYYGDPKDIGEIFPVYTME